MNREAMKKLASQESHFSPLAKLNEEDVPMAMRNFWYDVTGMQCVSLCKVMTDPLPTPESIFATMQQRKAIPPQQPTPVLTSVSASHVQQEPRLPTNVIKGPTTAPAKMSPMQFLVSQASASSSAIASSRTPSPVALPIPSAAITTTASSAGTASASTQVQLPVVTSIIISKCRKDAQFYQFTGTTAQLSEIGSKPYKYHIYLNLPPPYHASNLSFRLKVADQQVGQENSVEICKLYPRSEVSNTNVKIQVRFCQNSHKNQSQPMSIQVLYKTLLHETFIDLVLFTSAPTMFRAKLTSN